MEINHLQIKLEDHQKKRGILAQFFFKSVEPKKRQISGFVKKVKKMACLHQNNFFSIPARYKCVLLIY
jgi:hypothetical protein